MSSTAIGWERFAQADWAGARDAFRAALEEAPHDPDALDGLGQALWWLGERDAAIGRRREAYAIYKRAGDARRAGGLATYLAAEHRISGQEAEAAGWLARARRLLAKDGPTSEAGWLAVEEAKRAHGPAESERHAREALEIAHTLSDPDVECMALAQLGRARVQGGYVDDGLALLDEAMTIALGGETLDPLACGDACCTTLVVCDGLADLDRATQWCEAVVEFTERRRFIPVQSWCRGIFASVLVRAGDWARAEATLAEALRQHEDPRRGRDRALPVAVLADLRLRQGRLEDAEHLLAGLERHRAALVPLVGLHLQRGHMETARALTERAAELHGEDLQVVSLQAAVSLASGDREAAIAGARSLHDLAARAGRPDLVAEALLMEGRALAAAGDAEAARPLLDDAVGRFAALRTPLEEARARLALAEVHAALGSPLALDGARSACQQFEALGASGDADRAAALLRGLGASGRAAKRGSVDELTAREREVLALLVAGLSNPEIACRLVIAPKTAEHHVGRVLAKLGVRSRTEAVAHAVRQGL